MVYRTYPCVPAKTRTACCRVLAARPSSAPASARVRTSCSASAKDASLHTSAFGMREVDLIIHLAQNNVNHGLILDYLQAKESKITTQLNNELVYLNTEMVQLQGELNTERQRGEKEVVRLQGELNLERERGDKEVVRLKGDFSTERERLQAELQLMTAQYLQLRGKLDMRGLMEHIQDTMGVRTGVNWDKTSPVVSWRSYLAVRPSLKQCLVERYVSTDKAPQALSGMYATLSTAIHNTLTPDEYRQMGLKLHIGTPLKDGQQRTLMTCLCEDMNVPYKYMD